MQDFVGRAAGLARLASLLPAAVGVGEADTKPGQALLLRGEHGVGKTRLVAEFIKLAGVPSVYFSVPVAPIGEQLRAFARAVAGSNLPGAAIFREVQVTSWDAALRLLAGALPQTEPSIVAIDNLLALIDSDPPFEGTLAKLWDRELVNRPVLLACVGDDPGRMRALNDHDRPFFMRAAEMLVGAPTADQAWFWADEWQAGEREVDEHIAQGEVTTHGPTEAFLAHLDKLDEDGPSSP